MGQPYQNAAGHSPAMIYCPQCGQAMRVAPQHVQTQVACPHCRHLIEPWRVLGPAPAGMPGTPAPRRYGPARQGPDGYSWRNRWIAGVLGIVLGGFGVHRFYLGYTGIGILQIVVTVLTVGIVGPIW